MYRGERPFQIPGEFQLALRGLRAITKFRFALEPAQSPTQESTRETPHHYFSNYFSFSAQSPAQETPLFELLRLLGMLDGQTLYCETRYNVAEDTYTWSAEVAYGPPPGRGITGITLVYDADQIGHLLVTTDPQGADPEAVRYLDDYCDIPPVQEEGGLPGEVFTKPFCDAAHLTVQLFRGRQTTYTYPRRT